MTNKTKVSNYFIRKAVADRLKAGESVPAYEVTLWGYDDLGPLNTKRVDQNDPEALIACDLLLGETS